MIKYQIEKNLKVEEFREVLIKSIKLETSFNDIERIKNMIENANLIITARDEDTLVGVSRSLTDYSFCTYLADLAVDINYQNIGIGQELIRLTNLLSAPLSNKFNPHLFNDKF
ncbi:MAG: GNAT family N-acetyltransferase [Ferruginibacter sp.]